MDGALLRNDEGKFLPEGTFLDATLHPIGSGVRMRLSKAIVNFETVTLYIGDEENDELAFARFDLLTPPDELEVVDAYGRPAGLLVSESDRLVIFQAWGPGTHEFTQEQTGFVAAVCIPVPDVVLRGFILEDGSVFTGDIWLVADDGVVITPELHTPVQSGYPAAEDSLVQQQVVRIDVVGDPLFRRRLCAGLFTTPTFLKQITVRRHCEDIVCVPDEFGDFKITVSSHSAPETILRIRATSDGLRIEAVGESLKSIK